MIKLTIIGAGSAVFTRRIVTDLLAIEQFKNMEIALQDIDPVRLKASHDLIDVISKKLNVSPKVTSHTDRRESLVGADFVQTTIQVGGYEPSTVIDFKIPNEFGLKQTIADTLGIGGIMRGLTNNSCFTRYCKRYYGYLSKCYLVTIRKSNVLKHDCNK